MQATMPSSLLVPTRVHVNVGAVIINIAVIVIGRSKDAWTLRATVLLSCCNVRFSIQMHKKKRRQLETNASFKLLWILSVN